MRSWRGFQGLVEKGYKGKLKLEGGIAGLYMRILIRRTGGGERAEWIQ